MTSVLTENADIKNFFEKKMCKDVCDYMCNEFLPNNKFVVNKEYPMTIKHEPTRTHGNTRIKVIKRTTKTILYKFVFPGCVVMRYGNASEMCDNKPHKCFPCKWRIADETYRKKIFVDGNGFEYIKPKYGEGAGDLYRVLTAK
jgi:hypothetical protein